jgi:hypothetical protein
VIVVAALAFAGLGGWVLLSRADDTAPGAVTTESTSASPGPPTGSPNSDGAAACCPAEVEAPQTSGSYNFHGNQPLPINADRIVEDLTKRWRLKFISSSLYSAGTWRDGTRLDPQIGAMQAIIISDNENRLRSIDCSAGDPNGGALSSDGRQFLDDCALSAFIGDDRQSLDTWLDQHVPLQAIPGTFGSDMRQIETRVSQSRALLAYGPGVVKISVSRPMR